MQSMLQAGFTSNLVLYAASGLLTYGANDGETSGHIYASRALQHLHFAHCSARPVMLSVSPLLVAACWLQVAVEQLSSHMFTLHATCIHCSN